MSRWIAALLLALGAALLVAGFMWLRPPATTAADTPAVAAGAAPVAAAVGETPVYTDDGGARRIEWTLRDGQRIAGPEQVSVKVGTLLILRVTSDQRDALHLHGYDLQAELQPGEPGTLTFSAEHSGRFELELHGQHQLLAILEVQP